jgi:hypothetical protein
VVAVCLVVDDNNKNVVSKLLREGWLAVFMCQLTKSALFIFERNVEDG